MSAVVLFACSCVSSAVAMYTSQLTETIQTHMIENGQIWKCWALEINH